MTHPSLLAPEWVDWLSENLSRDCDPDELYQIMLIKGVTAPAAQSALATLQAQRRHTELFANTQPEAPVIFSVAPKPPAATPELQGPLPKPLMSLPTPHGPCRATSHVSDPIVVVYDNFMSADECDALITAAQHVMSPSMTVDDDNGASRLHPDRTSQGMFFIRGENEMVRNIELRAAALMNLPFEHGEGIQVLNYRLTGEYRPHFDYFPPERHGSYRQMLQGGQRVATLIMYLNEVEAGGETIFPELKLSVVPKKGSAVYFSYYDPTTGEIDPRSLHGGAPVTAGEKWIATKWVRQYVY